MEDYHNLAEYDNEPDLGTFTEEVCDDFEEQLANGDIDLVPSSTEFPAIPALCNEMVSDDVADLVEADNKYRECMTKQDWLENELDVACD
jgi:hypothetical protein